LPYSAQNAAGLEQLMTKRFWKLAGALLLVASLSPLPTASADFEVAAPDGRRALLKGDGTWSYVETDKAKEEEKIVVTGEGVLTLEQMVELGQNCRIGVRLQNDTNYEIRSLVPRFEVFRANGVIYEGRTLGFYSVHPGNSVYRETLFRGITCSDIGRIKVTGGDRCVMGDLDRFSFEGGVCLQRVNVVPNDRVRFDK
jgi:hypothetical protein